MSDDFNMSMRKFLKQVGVTSQQEIEKAVREAGGAPREIRVKMVLTSDDVDLNHTVDGVIAAGGDA